MLCRAEYMQPKYALYALPGKVRLGYQFPTWEARQQVPLGSPPARRLVTKKFLVLSSAVCADVGPEQASLALGNLFRLPDSNIGPCPHWLTG